MSDPTERTDPPPAGPEADQLHAFLDYHRATLQQKVAGLDAAGLAATLPSSTMHLAGLLKHLTLVEDHWFSVFLLGHEQAPAWVGVDWDADPDWEWRTALDDDPDDLRRLHAEAVTRSRELVVGLDPHTPAVSTFRDGGRPNLRWVVVHMIEEYARHNGHADLLRESVDGVTGE